MSHPDDGHDHDREERTTERPEQRPDHTSDEAELAERDAGAHAEQVTGKPNFEPGDRSDT